MIRNGIPYCRSCNRAVVYMPGHLCDSCAEVVQHNIKTGQVINKKGELCQTLKTSEKKQVN